MLKVLGLNDGCCQIIAAVVLKVHGEVYLLPLSVHHQWLVKKKHTVDVKTLKSLLRPNLVFYQVPFPYLLLSQLFSATNIVNHWTVEGLLLNVDQF